MKKIILSTTLVIGLMSGCSSNHLVNSIEINSPKLYPEGISYSTKKERFFLGSYYHGSIISVDGKGNIKEFVNDQELVSVIGIKVDQKRDRVIVCNSDSGFGKKSSEVSIGKLAQIRIYDLDSGKLQETIDLSHLYQGGHFVNDLTIDLDGNIYVTDSFSPVIYKIDTKAKASILTQSEVFQAPQGSFGLNGIVYLDEYLIVAKANEGKLYKVSLKNPQDIQEILLDKRINSIDGLLLQKDNALILVSNNFANAPFDEAVYKIQSTDNWESGKVKAVKKIEGEVFPTTLTEVADSIYVNYSYLPDLIMDKPTVAQFKIQKITF